MGQLTGEQDISLRPLVKEYGETSLRICALYLMAFGGPNDNLGIDGNPFDENPFVALTHHQSPFRLTPETIQNEEPLPGFWQHLGMRNITRILSNIGAINSPVRNPVSWTQTQVAFVYRQAFFDAYTSANQEAHKAGLPEYTLPQNILQALTSNDRRLLYIRFPYPLDYILESYHNPENRQYPYIAFKDGSIIGVDRNTSWDQLDDNNAEPVAAGRAEFCTPKEFIQNGLDAYLTQNQQLKAISQLEALGLSAEEIALILPEVFAIQKTDKDDGRPTHVMSDLLTKCVGSLIPEAKIISQEQKSDTLNTVLYFTMTKGGTLEELIEAAKRDKSKRTTTTNPNLMKRLFRKSLGWENPTLDYIHLGMRGGDQHMYLYIYRNGKQN